MIGSALAQGFAEPAGPPSLFAVAQAEDWPKVVSGEAVGVCDDLLFVQSQTCPPSRDELKIISPDPFAILGGDENLAPVRYRAAFCGTGWGGAQRSLSITQRRNAASFPTTAARSARWPIDAFARAVRMVEVSGAIHPAPLVRHAGHRRQLGKSIVAFGPLREVVTLLLVKNSEECTDAQVEPLPVSVRLGRAF